MRAFAACVLCLLLAACEKQGVAEAEAATKRYDLIKKSGSLDEACNAATAVRDAYLTALDDHNYKLWSAIADTDCMTARQEGGSLPADDATRDKLLSDAANLELEAASNAIEAAGAAVEAAADPVVTEPSDADDAITADEANEDFVGE